MIHLEIGSSESRDSHSQKPESLRQKSEPICHKRTGVFSLLFQEKKLLKKFQNFCFWGCKKAALSKYGKILLLYPEKSSEYADVDVSKLNGSVLPYPVRCPNKRRKGISDNLIFCVQTFWKFMRLRCGIHRSMYTDHRIGQLKIHFTLI